MESPRKRARARLTNRPLKRRASLSGVHPPAGKGLVRKECIFEQTGSEPSGKILGLSTSNLWACAPEEAFPQMAAVLFCSAWAILSTFLLLLVRVAAQPCPLPTPLVLSKRVALERYDLLPYKAVI
jgi:hypothetical protein